MLYPNNSFLIHLFIVDELSLYIGIEAFDTGADQQSRECWLKGEARPKRPHN